MPETESPVFISYSRSDEDRARAFKDRLHDAGIQARMDTGLITVGDDWYAGVIASIESAVLVVLICTKSSIESHRVTFEWSYALGLGIPVVPVVYEADLDMPPGLQTIDRLNFVDPRARQWDRLFARIAAERAAHHLNLGTLRRLGVENVMYGRRQFPAQNTIQQIIGRTVESSLLMVIGRSLEAWAREFEAIQSACRRKALRVKMALVDPALDPADWFIQDDYAAVDLTSSISKFKLIKVPADADSGSFELYFLPNSPLCSFTYFEDPDGVCGVLELGASLGFDQRFGMFLRNRDAIGDVPLTAIYESFDRILRTRTPVIRVGADDLP
jgi:hypothetical protein